MNGRILKGFILILIVASAALLIWQFDDISQQIGQETADITRSVSTPGPLRRLLEEPRGQLSIEGIAAETNRHRSENGKPPLTFNTQLSAAARAKTADMLAQQYFDHVSPDGRGPSDVIEAAGYEYITVGENLALGGFESDADLVQAWMDSPGHRANILSDGFQEIGVAAVLGVFDGRETWVSVQEFGTPLSACGSLSAAGQAKIDASIKQLDVLKAELDANAEEISRLAALAQAKLEEGNQQIEEGNRITQETGDRDQAQPYWDRGRSLQQEAETIREQYEAERIVYNEATAEYNELQSAIQKLVEKYNQQIKTFNACVKEFTNA